MTTIYADELIHAPLHAGTASDRSQAPSVAAIRHARKNEPAAPAPRRPRYEDFETRSAGLADLLAGQVFPRVF